MSHFNFSIWAFSINFCPIKKVICLATLFDSFARYVECDFWGDFPTL